MDAQYLSSLEETLRQTQVPDSAAIKAAVSRLQKEFYTKPLAIPALLQILQSSSDEALQHLAAVEARKLIISQWEEKVDAAVKPQIREAMLTSAFNVNFSKKIRHSIARVVTSIGEVDLEENQWPELLPFLVKNVNESDIAVKEMAVFTLYTLLETQIPSLVPHVDDFLSLFSNLLSDASSKEIRVNAVSAMDVVSQFIDEDVEINQQLASKFQQAVPSIFQVLKEVISEDDSENAKNIFNVLNNLIFVDTKLVGEHLITLVQLTVEIASNTTLDEEYRVFALQFLISCVSLRKSKITSSKLGPTITLAALKISTEEIDVEEELTNDNEENENEENSPSTLGLRLLAMLSAELPPSQVVVPLFEHAQQLVMNANSNQFERRAGLLSIAVASSGAPDFVATHVNKVVIPALTHGLNDSELLVRIAALRTLTSLTSELQDNIAENHQLLLPPVMKVIDSADSMKAYRYACMALDGIIEFMSHDVILEYLEPLMVKLFGMLNQATTSALKSAIVSAIGSAAYAAGKGFTPYFNGSIERLEPFISAPVVDNMTEEDIELRALTFENISTMARAVGSESFAQYASPLVEAAYQSLSSEHSRIRESGFAFITNMARVYGQEFAGFLERIVPEILKCLEQEEFVFDNFNEDDEDDEEEDIDNKFNVHTGITIEKEIASVALAELATGTGKSFAPYVEASLKTLNLQVEESYGMREACMNAMWKILIAMFKTQVGEDFKAPKGVPTAPYVDESIIQIIQQVRETSISLLEEEFDLTMVACILDNIAEAALAMGPVAVISNAQDSTSLEKLCVQVMNVLKKEHPCQADEEEAPVDEEDSSETEALLFETCAEVLVALSGALQGDFVKVFTGFKAILIQSTTAKSKNKRVSSTGALSEIAHSLKAAVNPYLEELLAVFTDRLANDKSLEVRGNAAYGVGNLIENSTTDLSSIYNNVLTLLFQLLNKTERRAANTDADEESKDIVNRSYANASGCVARMALKNEAAVPLEHVLGPLFDHLPLETGLEENEPIFELIIKLYQNDNAVIASHTPKIVEVFAGIFTKESERLKLISQSTLGREENIERFNQFATKEIKNKVIELLRFLDGKFGGVVSANPVLKAVI